MDIIIYMDTPKTIGELIHQYRMDMIQDRGDVISQYELAKEFGISYGLFNKYYNDERVPDGENLKRIADKTGPVAYQLAGRVPVEIEEQIKQVPPEHLEDLKDYISRYLIENGWARKD